MCGKLHTFSDSRESDGGVASIKPWSVNNVLEKLPIGEAVLGDERALEIAIFVVDDSLKRLHRCIERQVPLEL